MESLLRLTTDENTESSDYDGIYLAKIVDCYDGDTCTAVFFTPEGRLVKETLRLYGINTPELNRGSAEVRAEGLRARSRLVEITCGESPGDDKKFFPEHSVLVRLDARYGRGSFGRLLAVLYAYDEMNLNFPASINNQMMSEGLAVVYKRR